MEEQFVEEKWKFSQYHLLIQTLVNNWKKPVHRTSIDEEKTPEIHQNRSKPLKSQTHQFQCLMPTLTILLYEDKVKNHPNFVFMVRDIFLAFATPFVSC